MRRTIKKIIWKLKSGYRPKQFWDNWANSFLDDPWQRKIHPQHEYLLHKIKQTKPQSILEVGCGFGRNIKYLIDNGIDPKKITAADISKRMINLAKDYVGNKDITFVVADAKKLPFTDREFEFVFLHGVLMHVSPENIENVISEIFRVSNKYVVFIEQNYKPESENMYTFIHNYSTFLNSKKYKKVEYRNFKNVGLDFWYVEIR